MSRKTVPTKAPEFLVHKAVTSGDAPIWAELDAEEKPREEAYNGPERRSGADRRSNDLARRNFGGIERRVVAPFGRRKSDRAD